ncbi:MAG: hypothetical protein ACKVOL_02920 [Novosphingobium sp.]
MPPSDALGRPAELPPVLPTVLPPAAPLESNLRKWSGWVGPVISVAILAAVLLQLRELNWATVWSIVPTSPLIWFVLAASYFAGPVADWIIFRKLWGIPPSGILPLLKKLIGNELLLGYVGEVYFYDWARRHVKMAGSPFGAVKDVAILSALAGNIMTLIMLIVTWPIISKLGLGGDGNVLATSIGVVLVTSLVIMFFRNGLLSLPRSQLWFVLVAHCGRIVANTGLSALAWHLILPSVGIGPLLLLSTVRLLLSRLPLIPNKDIAFAGISTLLAGSQVQTSEMIAMISLLIVTTHVVLFIALVLLDLVQKEKNA